MENGRKVFILFYIATLLTKVCSKQFPLSVLVLFFFNIDAAKHHEYSVFAYGFDLPTNIIQKDPNVRVVHVELRTSG